MNYKWLKYLRWVLAVLIGGTILIFFLDIRGTLPTELHALLHLQLVPAILAASLAALAVITLLTLLFGRLYCSILCPLGIMQDVILRVKKWWYMLRKQKKKLYTKYSKPLNILRYSILSGVGIFLIAGIVMPLLWLDPYSTFGRIATSLFKPVAVWMNNIAADLLNSMGNYSLYRITLESTASIVLISSAVILVAIIIAVWRRERIVCNSICPVGTMLGLLSKFSLFKITIKDSCTHCKQCERSCKSRCIDSKEIYVDSSRCVTCFNCLEKCKYGAMAFSPTGWKAEPKPKMEKDKFALSASGLARRRFIKGSAMTIAALASSKVLAQADSLGLGGTDVMQIPDGTGHEEEHLYLTKETQLPMPPGVISKERFLQKCTACQLCVSKCPTQVLQPAFLENGLTGMMTPVMKFRVESFCNYDCKVCTEVCPTHAIIPISLEEKKLTRVGNVKFFKQHCVVIESLQDCGACAEHCPTQAVHMVPYGDTGLTMPEITPDLCIGCGGCQSICPVVPAAIRITGVTQQDQAARPSVDVMDDIQISDFGF